MKKKQILFTKKDLLGYLEKVDFDETDSSIYYELDSIADLFEWNYGDDRLSKLFTDYHAEEFILDAIYDAIHKEREDDGEFYRNEEEYDCDLQDILDYVRDLTTRTDCHDGVYQYTSTGGIRKVSHEELIQIKDKMAAILKEEE